MSQRRATRRGRPLKFGRPARSVTVTLPEDDLATLRARNRDVGRAIVSLVRGTGAPPDTDAPAVVVHQSDGRAVIVVDPVPALRRLDGIELISVGDPHRALIAFKGGISVAQFELLVQDLLDSPHLPARDHSVVSQLVAILRDARRRPGVRLSEAAIIVIEGTRASRARGAVGKTRRRTDPGKVAQ